MTGSVDIGLEEVETAANLVQQAAHPEALIIFGATFDEEMEDEIRVTVIATGFEEGNGALPDQPFTRAGEKVEEQKQDSEQAADGAAEEKKEEKRSETGLGESDFDAIFQIFNKKK